MIMNRFRRQLTLLVLLMGLSGLSLLSIAQETTPEPSHEVTSFFSNDNCVPPCWFGLTPGVSNAEEVAAWVDIHIDGTFATFAIRQGGIGEPDPEAGYITTGTYGFRLLPHERPDVTQRLPSWISVHNGMLEFIFIYIHEFVTSDQVLISLGEPDYVRLGYNYYYYYLDFIYIDSLVRVSFVNDVQNCEITQFGTEFWVNRVHYYSSDYAYEIIPNRGEYRPRIFAYGEDRDVPLEIFHEWLVSDNPVSCQDAFRELPRDPLIPAYPSPTPTEDTE